MAARAVRTPAKKTTTTKTPTKRVVKKTAAAPPQTQIEVLIEENRAYVPDPVVAQTYVGREVFGKWDVVIANSAMKEGHNLLLDGPTGAGKTMFGEAFASKYQMLYYSFPCDVSADPSAAFGRVQPVEGDHTSKLYEWVDGPVTQIWRNGGVLNISELNMMMPKIAASFYSLLDGRRYINLIGHKGENVRAHRGTEGRKPCWCSINAKECNSKRVLVIADMNGKYRGTMDLNAAFKNRWKYKLPWGYDAKVEEKLVKFPTLRAIATQIREQDTVIYTPVSTNMLMEFEEIAVNPDLGPDFAIHNFLAAFENDEQQPISKVIDLNRKKLADDIAFITKDKSTEDAGSDDDVSDIEWEMEEEER